MIAALTTNVTSFYREPHHFKHLREAVLPDLVARARAGGRVRLWSAGCSSGMEPYSIAITLAEALSSQRAIDARILATDIDSAMLQTGMRGVYPEPDLRDVPVAARRFFRAADHGEVTMPPATQGLIAFKQLNLLDDWPMRRRYDAIFCRNVVIYFDKPTKQRLFDRMADQLQPDGLLYIGHSENLTGISDRFQLVGRTVYRRVS